MKRALALALVLVGCRSTSKPPITSSRDVNVGTVTAPPITTKQSCGPEENAGLELDQVYSHAIRAICIRGTDEKMRADVMTYLRLKIGDKVFEETLRRDVVSLYESGFFRKVDVLAAKKDDGIELTYELEVRPKSSLPH